ncbi:uncharacterized protein BDZ99DRAFT_522521 [Mytilinidion resinicola]|uniref:Mid2 domain-containing protein n=1 Tax=Mytilinidion resinicola TaxID=574789 RepID=A0A6A6YGH9_9PEZI|nr:uncharacterized protein BDZ99DRAFT_522521 [Mytilinidion resinicola]KAF2807912.1 hypothetical protein BDZ99DRAFT_522521 [Mytilinidion resinicola]
MFKLDAAFTLSLLLQHFFIAACSAGSCFAFDGLEYPDNQVCPGSSACCGYNATCLPNRLCHNNGDPETTLIRGPCAVDPWDNRVCSQICLYNESDNGNFFPRVFVCQDGSLCCDNDRQCCQNNRGVFLDDNGNILTASPTSRTSTAQLTTSSRTTSSFVTSISTQQASTTPSSVLTSQNPTSPSSPGSHGLSTESKVGLGVGVPFGIAALIGLGAIAYFIRRRGQARSVSDRVELVSSARPYRVDQHASEAEYMGIGADLPHKPRDENKDRRETVRYEMPAGFASPRELPSSFK